MNDEFFAEDLERILLTYENETLREIFNTSLFANRSIPMFHKKLSNTVLLVVSFYILVVISVFGNALVCHVIFKNRKLYTVTNMFIANMAISDLFMVLLNVPLNIARHLMDEWTLGDFLCHLLNLSLMVSVYVSTFTLTAIALDRQRVLTYPPKPRLTRKKGFIILGIIWIMSIVMSLPFGIFTTVQEVDMLTLSKVKRCQPSYPMPSHLWEQYWTLTTIILQYVIPLTVIAVTYTRIVHTLWLRTHLGVVTERQRVIQIQAKRKSIKLLVAIVVVFAVCWLPLNLYHILTDFHPNTKLFPYNSTVFFICHWVAISSSCINPFLYCWMNPTFREALSSKCSCFAKIRYNGRVVELDELLTPISAHTARLHYRSNYPGIRSGSGSGSGSSSSAERYSLKTSTRGTATTT